MTDSTRRALFASALIATSLSTPITGHTELWDNEALPMVLTPARLKQSRSEVPASVSVIDREMIIASGLRRIPELFRLIPGTSVGARDGWNHVVSYHGTNYRDSRRMQVLIDGRSIYQAGLATVNWNDIPLAIEDIERIEVVRGPSTASYGANAFLGVINIISRHPEDSERLIVKARRGSNRTEDYLFSHAGSAEGGDYRVSLQTRRDDGFDEDRDGKDRRDSDNSEMINLRYEKPIASANLSVNLGYKQGWTTDDFGDFDVSSPDTQHKNHFVSVKLGWDLHKNHSQHLRYDYSGQKQIKQWTAMLPPAFLGQPNHPSPLVTATANENIRQTRQDVEFQDTMIWNAKVKTVSGVHFKHSQVSSETYYNGNRRSDSVQLFGNIEYAASKHISTNFGASWERDDNEKHSHFSPRLAMHYHINNNHSFRAVFSEAVRTPDLLETSADWSYRVHDIQPHQDGMSEGQFIITASGNPELKSERILSREIGYYGHYKSIGLQWDVKIFRDKLKQLVSDSTALDKFSPENNNHVEQQGVETELDYRPNQAWLLHASYSYINSDSSSQNEQSFTPSNAASAMVSYKWRPHTQLSLSRYYSQNTRTGNKKNHFSRSDLRISHRPTALHNRLELAYVLQYRHDNNSELLSDNFYKDSTRHLLSISMRY